MEGSWQSQNGMQCNSNGEKELEYFVTLIRKWNDGGIPSVELAEGIRKNQNNKIPYKCSVFNQARCESG